MIPQKSSESLDQTRGPFASDSADEADFDDLATLAMQICQTPVALIRLEDSQRIVLKSRSAFTAADIPSTQALCAQTLLNKELLLVCDLLREMRLGQGPNTRGPCRLRFYAGMPLRSASGRRLGVLCVLDDIPRHLSVDQQTRLKALAAQVVARLEASRPDSDCPE